MRQNDIIIGGTYRCRVGDRIATVTVLRMLPGRAGARARYLCETHDTRREVKATAARLRPVPGTPDHDRERARKAAAAATVRAPRPFAGPVGEATVDAVPVPGILARVGSSPVSALSEANRDTIRRIVDRVHVAEAFPVVARAVRRRIAAQVIFRTIPRALRRGILYEAAARHGAGRRMYRAAMGHAPLPSERMVAEAVGIACGLGPMPR